MASGSKIFGQRFNYYHQVFMQTLAGYIGVVKNGGGRGIGCADPGVGACNPPATAPRCARRFLFPSAPASELASLPEIKNAADEVGSAVAGVLRRERDSNPRKCYLQQFSRLPQSTALPSLRAQNNESMIKLPNIFIAFLTFT